MSALLWCGGDVENLVDRHATFTSCMYNSSLWLLMSNDNFPQNILMLMAPHSELHLNPFKNWII